MLWPLAPQGLPLGTHCLRVSVTGRGVWSLGWVKVHPGGESCGSVWMSVRVPTAGRACLCSGSGGVIRDRPHSWGLSALTILAGSFPSRSHSSWQSPLVTGTGSEPSVLYTHRRLDQGSLCPGMASLILGAVPK